MADERSPSTDLYRLEQLLSPASETQFQCALRDRKLTVLRRRQPETLSELLNWQAIRARFSRGEYPRGKDCIRISKEGEFLPSDQWVRNGKVDPVRLDILLSQGFNLTITHIE